MTSWVCGSWIGLPRRKHPVVRAVRSNSSSDARARALRGRPAAARGAARRGRAGRLASAVRSRHASTKAMISKLSSMVHALLAPTVSTAKQSACQATRPNENKPLRRRSVRCVTASMRQNLPLCRQLPPRDLVPAGAADVRLIGCPFAETLGDAELQTRIQGLEPRRRRTSRPGTKIPAPISAKAPTSSAASVEGDWPTSTVRSLSPRADDGRARSRPPTSSSPAPSRATSLRTGRGRCAAPHASPAVCRATRSPSPRARSSRATSRSRAARRLTKFQEKGQA